MFPFLIYVGATTYRLRQKLLHFCALASHFSFIVVLFCCVFVIGQCSCFRIRFRNTTLHLSFAQETFSTIF